MQTDRIAGGARPSGTVHGLGVCDALRLELRPAQVPWLIDELEEMRTPLEEEVQRLPDSRSTRGSNAVEPQLDQARYELWLLRMLRAQLRAGDDDGPVVFVGPAGMVGEIARNTMRYALTCLSDLVHADDVGDPERAAQLGETADAARAWIETYLDCRAIETYSFDPDADPARSW